MKAHSLTREGHKKVAHTIRQKDKQVVSDQSSVSFQSHNSYEPGLSPRLLHILSTQQDHKQQYCPLSSTYQSVRMSDDASGIDLRSGKFLVLTSSNFTDWLDLAQTVLISRSLWEYATGEITKGSTAEDKKSFRQEDAKAVAFLKLAAGREQRAHLLRLTSSKDVLEKLKSVYQVLQLERVQALLSEFHTFKV